MDPLPTPPPGYETQSPDTAYWAEKLKFDHGRTLGPRAKAARISAVCESVWRIWRVGVSLRHPEASESEVLEVFGERLDRAYRGVWARELRVADLLDRALVESGLPPIETHGGGPST